MSFVPISCKMLLSFQPTPMLSRNNKFTCWWRVSPILDVDFNKKGDRMERDENINGKINKWCFKRDFCSSFACNFDAFLIIFMLVTIYPAIDAE